MNRITCSRCRNTWTEDQLLNYGWAAITAEDAIDIGILHAYNAAHHGVDHVARRHVSQRVYERAKAGDGCPYCGFHLRAGTSCRT